MSTGSIQDQATLVVKNLSHDDLQLGFTNDSGGDLVIGDEIILKTDGTVDKRDANTEYPVGVVIVGGADGERITARVKATAVMNVNNVNAGTVNAGSFVFPDGTKTNGYPDYDVLAQAVADVYSQVIVLKGATTGGRMVVALLNYVKTIIGTG